MSAGFVFVAGGYYHHNQTWSADSTTVSEPHAAVCVIACSSANAQVCALASVASQLQSCIQI